MHFAVDFASKQRAEFELQDLGKYKFSVSKFYAAVQDISCIRLENYISIKNVKTIPYSNVSRYLVLAILTH